MSDTNIDNYAQVANDLGATVGPAFSGYILPIVVTFCMLACAYRLIRSFSE